MTLLVVLAPALTACGKGEDRPGSASASNSGTGDTTTTAFKAADATATVEVKAHEYVFDGIPATPITGPRVLFTVHNTGTVDHEFEVVGADGEPVADIHVDKGKTGTLAVKLKPGTYTAECMLKTGSKTHASLGMKTAFTVS
jgi:uncharacterized cupredoxin-like copper-binding protein